MKRNLASFGTLGALMLLCASCAAVPPSTKLDDSLAPHLESSSTSSEPTIEVVYESPSDVSTSSSSEVSSERSTETSSETSFVSSDATISESSEATTSETSEETSTAISSTSQETSETTTEESSATTEETTEPTTEPTTETTEPVEATAPDSTVVVYYPLTTGTPELALAREVHPAVKADGLARQAVQALIDGKIQTEGAGHALPPSTRVLGVHITDGTCIVNFSKEVLDLELSADAAEQHLDALANTLLEFPSVKTIELWVDGSQAAAQAWWGHADLSDRAWTRRLDRVTEPAIWVNEPQPKALVTDIIRVTGSAMTSEATVHYRLEDATGKRLYENVTTGTNAQGARSFFEFSITIPEGMTDTGRLVVFATSAVDSTQIDPVDIPLRFR